MYSNHSNKNRQDYIANNENPSPITAPPEDSTISQSYVNGKNDDDDCKNDVDKNVNDNDGKNDDGKNDNHDGKNDDDDKNDNDGDDKNDDDYDKNDEDDVKKDHLITAFSNEKSRIINVLKETVVMSLIHKLHLQYF